MKSRSVLLANLRSIVRRWHTSRTANATMLFCAAMIPMVGIIGLGIDYYTGLSHKARLDAAADSAAIAAITTAKAYISANSSSQIDPLLTLNAIAAGQAQGVKVFGANAGATARTISAVPTVTVTRSLQTFSATATYSGNMKTSFGKLFAVPTFGIKGTSTSTLTMGSYLDFYIALDVSGSMGLPTSNDGQSTLARFNNDNASSYPSGCVFACHFAGYQGYTVARQKSIQLRVDSVGIAVSNLIATADATRTLTNQYRIGIYPFIVHLMQAAALSSDFTAAKQIFNNANPNYFADTYLDTGLANSSTSSMGSGGTHFENVMPDVNNYVKSIGNGSSALTPRPFLFIVTDGADNNQTYTSSSGFNGSQPQRPNNWGYCQYAQLIGVTVAILYIPYVPIQNPNASFAGNEDGKVNAVIPYIPSDLQACASPGFFFTANSNADINNAMQAMFAQALAAARLTN